MTLVEVAVGVALLTLAFSGLGGLLAVNERSCVTSHEEALASNALRGMAERLRAVPFTDLASSYSGYQEPVADLGGTCSVIIYADETATSAEAALVGLPRDLDGDGLAANVDVSGNYMLLPVRVQVTWTNELGQQSRSLVMLLAQEG